MLRGAVTEQQDLSIPGTIGKFIERLSILLKTLLQDGDICALEFLPGLVCRISKVFHDNVFGWADNMLAIVLRGFTIFRLLCQAHGPTEFAASNHSVAHHKQPPMKAKEINQ